MSSEVGEIVDDPTRPNAVGSVQPVLDMEGNRCSDGGNYGR